VLPQSIADSQTLRVVLGAAALVVLTAGSALPVLPLRKADIAFRAGEAPYVQTRGIMAAGSQGAAPGVWYRVGVTNLSWQAIDDVQVEIARITPAVGIEFFPLPPLALMHDSKRQPTFVVNPGMEPDRFVDLASKIDATPKIQLLSYSADGLPLELPAGSYEIDLRVKGRTTWPRERRFRMSVDSGGRLQLERRR